MALTDKSVIPLNVHDLRVVEGQRCFLDRRINLRLGYGRGTKVRDLIKRNKDDFEARFGPVHHRGVRVQMPQGGSQDVTEYWLTKGQALWVCRKSDARNADDVMEEVIKVFLAVDAGAPIPETPWTDALFAPDKPVITRGDDNVVHIKHEKPLHDLFGIPPPIADDDDDPDDSMARSIWRGGPPLTRVPNTLALDRWNDAGWHIRRRCDAAGIPLMVWLTADDAISTPQEKKWLIPSPNGRSQVLFCFNNPFPPIEVVMRTYDSLGPGPYAPVAKATLRHFLA